MRGHAVAKFVILILLGFVISTPSVPVAKAAGADWLSISPDIDGDGLPNETETTGWCNGIGCFQTDPFDPDSDDDTLTDGEEKLFDSDPQSDASPGIYIIYENDFSTKEYYPWLQYGHKLIARQDLGTNLDAAVVRRGTTFYVGGPIEFDLKISKSISGLSTLSKSRDPYNGEWRVTVPSNGTAGKYRLSLGNHSLDLLVIFELPKPSGELKQLSIEKFLYNDNPGKTQDEISIMLGDYENRRYPPKSIPSSAGKIPAGEWLAEGWGYKFYNQQYDRFILEDYVIEAINGTTDQKTAASRLTERVDQETIFRNPRVLVNSWKTLNPGSNPRNQCSNISGLLTAFNRAAGIPARPVMTDWKTSSFDHATEIWVDGQWRTYRGYNKWEMGPEGDDTPLGCTTNWPKCGSLKYYTRYNWGRLKYKPWHSGGGGTGNVIVLANETWTNTPSPAYRWPTWNKTTWYAPGPDTTVTALGTSMVRHSWFETQNSKYWEYWGWTKEPDDTGNPPNAWPEGLIGGSSTLETTETGTLPADDFQSAEVQLGQVLAEYGVDSNRNGQYDQLVLEVEVTASKAGHYWLLAQLGSSSDTPLLMGTGGIIAQSLVSTDLAEGSQTIQLIFEGEEISLKRLDGPYVLTGLWITNVPDPGFTEFMNDSLAFRENAYTTSFYQATDFETYGAMLSDSYTHYDFDSDGNGHSDTLVINTGITVFQPGSYSVEGSLFDNQDQFIARAAWSGSGPDVSLQFNELGGTSGPYTLRELDLLDAAGQSIDYLNKPYTVGLIPAFHNPDLASFDIYPSGDELSALGEMITPTNAFDESLIDGDLQFQAEVQVSKAGLYKLEAWLVDSDANLITWASSPAQSLSPGLQKLNLTFDGRNIRARGNNGPYTVVGVKILDGNGGYKVLDEVDVALTTQNYSVNQFREYGVTFFEDFAESGTGKWKSGTPWSISKGRHLYFGPSKAWHTDDSGSLRLAQPLNLAGSSLIALKFHTSWNFGNSETGYIELSTNGSNWVQAATYSGNGSWSDRIQIVDLSDFAGQPTVYLRFRLGANNSADGWYIDDIIVASAKGGRIFLPIVVK